MSKKTDFEVMSQMAGSNQDIRMSGNFVSVQKVKQGGQVVMGIDDKTLHDLLQSVVDGQDQKYYVALYVVNKQQFDQIKNEE